MTAIEELRQRARSIFEAGLRAALPDDAVRHSLETTNGRLRISLSDGTFRSDDWSRIYVISIGKAAGTMARAVADVLPDTLFPGSGIIVTNDENVVEIPRFRTYASGHPLPDARGVEAANAVAECAREARAGELFLVLISGGASALVPSPSEELELSDKINTTSLLMAAGGDIYELNTVRKHLSRLKGGGLARLAAPADVHALVLSDVIGDDLSTIASGPTVPDPKTFDDAIAATQKLGVHDRLSPRVRAHLKRGARGEIAETPKPDADFFERSSTTIVGGNRMSLDASLEAATSILDRVRILGDRICGEARVEARAFAEAALEELRNGEPDTISLLAGGETTVRVTGTGVGGRNQEFAVAFALAMEELAPNTEWVFLSGGTDGRDGPNDAAGGLVDPGSLARMRAASVDPREFLDNNDTYRALQASGDLLMTGSTGTNVADLQVFVGSTR